MIISDVKDWCALGEGLPIILVYTSQNIRKYLLEERITQCCLRHLWKCHCLWQPALPLIHSNIRITVRLSSQWGDCCRSEWLNITCYVNSWIFRVLHGVVHQKQLKRYENFSLRGLNVIKVLNRLFPADKVSISNTKFDKVWHFFFMLKISTKFIFVSQKPNTGS